VLIVFNVRNAIGARFSLIILKKRKTKKIFYVRSCPSPNFLHIEAFILPINKKET